MKIPGFVAEVSIYRSNSPYVGVGGAGPIHRNVVMPQVPFLYCALHAGACLLLAENPAAEVLCWTRFAEVCGGGEA
jgi:hypothetical protein